LKIHGEITWGHSHETLFNQLNNVVFSSCKRVPIKTCNDLDKWAVFKAILPPHLSRQCHTFFNPFTTSMENSTTIQNWKKAIYSLIQLPCCEKNPQHLRNETGNAGCDTHILAIALWVF